MSPTYSFKYWLKVYLIWAMCIATAHQLLRVIRVGRHFDLPQYWPISIGIPVLPVWQDILVLVTAGALGIAFIKAWQNHLPITHLLGIGALLIITINLLQGWQEGFIRPITGFGHADVTYWQDALRVRDIGSLFRNYTTLQPTLRDHTRVHPPLALLLYTAFTQLPSPSYGALFFLFSSVITTYMFWVVLMPHTKDAKYLSLLLLVVPSVNIYSIASLDSLIMLLFFICLVGWQHRHTKKGFISTVLALAITLLFTFAGILLLIVLPVVEWLQSKKLVNSLKVGILTIGGYVLIREWLGYDYYQSLMIAKSFENQGGFYLLVDPLSYLVTRIENILEIALFFTPPLTMILVHKTKLFLSSAKNMIHPTLNKQTHTNARQGLELTAIVLLSTLAAFFLAGAYYTGETARAAMFVYPWLLILVSNKLDSLNRTVKTQLLILILSQSTLMQLFGWYKW